jgi:Sulfotransferase domain
MEKLGRFPLSVILSYLDEADGVALLSTKRVYYNQLLPIFRVTASPPPLEESSSGRQQRPYRYRFRVVPVHDVSTLLARSNTMRLYRRRMNHPRLGLTTSQLAQIEWQEQQQTLSAPFPPHLELLRLSDPAPTTPTTTSATTILLASYPRSGNTLVRSLWEAVTNVVTGSDTRPDLPLAQQLDFCGEGSTTPSQKPRAAASLFLCKTHWPERRGYAAMNDASAVILLVRNPYDAIDSYWNMNATCTHTETVTDAVYHKYRTFFNRLVRNEIRVWIDYLTYWEREGEENGGNNNVLFVRYEDVARDPAGQVTQMLQFAMNHHRNRNHHQGYNKNNNDNNNNNNDDDNNDHHETEEESLSEFWQHRIRHAIAGRTSGSLGVYRPRTATGRGNSFGKSLKRYSKELIDYIEDTAESDPNQFLRRFGYSIRHQNFPANFVAGEPPRNCRTRSNNGSSNGSSPMAKHQRGATTTAATTAAAATTTITINVGASIRPSDCPFGRHMQAWRHSVTNNDQSPLPTVVPPQP